MYSPSGMPPQPRQSVISTVCSQPLAETSALMAAGTTCLPSQMISA